MYLDFSVARILSVFDLSFFTNVTSCRFKKHQIFKETKNVINYFEFTKCASSVRKQLQIYLLLFTNNTKHKDVFQFKKCQNDTKISNDIQ